MDLTNIEGMERLECIYGQGSFEKGLICELSEIYLIAYALWHELCLVCTHAIE